MHILQILLVVSLATSAAGASAKKKKTADWNKINMDEIEETWKSGDEEEELEHEMDHIMRVAAKKQQMTGIDFDRPETLQKLIKDPLGVNTKSAMVFIELTATNAKGEPWTEAAEKELAGKYAALLRTASLEATLFNLERGKLLANITKGWLLRDVLRFLLQQPEVAKATFDQKDYYPGHFSNDEDEF